MNLANNQCPCCHGKGSLSKSSVGFKLSVGDIVEDHCGLQVKIDEVYHKNPEIGWGTTLNAPNSWVCGPNHSNHRVETDNQYYTESRWKK